MQGTRLIKLFLGCLFISLLSSCGSGRSKAYDTLQGIKYKIEVGTSYIEYGKLLTEASVPVMSYLESPDAKKNKELTELVDQSWKYYVSALEVWQMKVKFGDYFWPEEQKIEMVISYAPMVATLNLDTSKRWKLDDIVQRLWSEAGSKTTKLKAAVGKT